MADQLPAMAAGQHADPDSDTGCGCIPPMQPVESVRPPQPDALPPPPDATAPELTADPPRRSLKLVVTLQLEGDDGYRAMVALGSADCDPLFRALDALDLPAALAVVPSVLAQAEEHWRNQPRYPSVRPTPKAKPPGRGERPAAPSAVAPQAEAAPPQSAPVTPTTPKSVSGQLSLFG